MTLSWAVTARSGQHLDRQLPQETLSIVTEVMVTHSHSCQRKCSVKECFVLASEVGMCIFFSSRSSRCFDISSFYSPRLLEIFSDCFIFFSLSLDLCNQVISFSHPHRDFITPPHSFYLTSPPTFSKYANILHNN